MIKKTLMATALLLCAAAPVQAAPHKLLVLSVDGLDWRYIRDRVKLGLKIPNIVRLLGKSQWADGVVGVWPTVTWPSHTAIITGARPDQHGILNNARGDLDPALSYWAVRKLNVPTLWQCAGDAGLATAAVTWPVTMEARITWNLPEVFVRRNGGSMDLDSVTKYATPGLVADITRAYPSFAQQWVDDRTRILATLFLLKNKKPDLILTHLVDLDSEAHDQGPFDTNANAILERTDELIGDVVKAMPKDYDLALVSDHGFERVDRIANLLAAQKAAGIGGDLKAMGGIAVTSDPKVADWLRAEAKKPDSDIGREIPHDELIQYAPKLSDAVAAFEPAPHVLFYSRDASGPVHAKPPEKGDHGFWPLRADYRSIFLLSGPGIKPAPLGSVEMLSLKDRLASTLGLSCK